MATKETSQNYQSISRPYNNLLERSSSGDTDSIIGATEQKSGDVSSFTSSQSGRGGSSKKIIAEESQSGSNGSVERQQVRTDGSMSDLWIKNFIRSENWKPKTQGFYIDGKKGYAEFSGVYISGHIRALTGLIGGWDIGASDLIASDGTNETVLSSGVISFYAGPIGAPKVTITQSGILSAEGAIISGDITAESGVIGGWNISPGAISKAAIVLDSDNDRITVSGTKVILDDSGITAIAGSIAGWLISDTTLSKSAIVLDSANDRITVGGTDVILDSNGITAIAGSIAGWELQSTLLRSASSGVRIELNKGENRISVFDAVNEKVVMGYLNGLPKHDGTGDWGPSNYGFWARTGDKLSIDGDGEYVNGDWIIQNDASYLVKDSADNTIVRLGTDTGQKGIFIYDTNGIQLSRFVSDEIFVGDAINFLKYTIAGGLEVGKIDVGTSGKIMGGQTDYGVGTGFFLGYNGAAHKFSLGSTTNYVQWDGVHLILKGSFDVGSDGLINNAAYTVANLPVIATIEGYYPPSAFE